MPSAESDPLTVELTDHGNRVRYIVASPDRALVEALILALFHGEDRGIETRQQSITDFRLEDQ